MKRSCKRLMVAVALLGGALGLPAARADQVIFNNGDRVTGKIESADGGHLVISTQLMGKITVALKDVKTFSTDSAVKLQLRDGTVINQPLAQGPDGHVTIAPTGALVAQAVEVAAIDKINFTPPVVKWVGSIAVNGSLTQGNVNSEQLGISIDAVRRADTDRIILDAGYQYARQKVNGADTTSQDNWFGEAEYDDFMSKQLYVYGDVRVGKDRIQDLDLRLTPGGGVGYQWIEKPDFNISTDAGLAWVYEKFTTVNTAREDVSLRLAYHIDKSFLDSKFKIFHNLQFFPSLQHTNNFLVITDLGLDTKITERMFSEIKAELDYDSNPAPGSKKADIKYIAALGWSF